ncbi:MAG: CARDB domain-containing protein [Gemmataceae bacterium]
MFKPSWNPFRPLRKLRPIRTRNLDLVKLEDRVVPTVYYFHGHNLFGPNHQQNDPYWTGDTGAWLNPYNWGLETAKGIVSGKGVPGSGDTVVFRGATEDGHSWTVYDGHTDANGNYDHGVNTNGGSVLAKENQSALTLNLDRNWGGQIVMQNGSTLSVGIGGGRWQSGALIGNVTNAGPLTIQPDASGTVSTAIGTFTNNGTITQTAGTFLIGGSGGAAPYGGTVVNHGTYAMTAGMIDGQFAATELFQNDGILTGSAGQVRVTTVTTKTGTLESTGTFHLQGPQTVNSGTIRATPGATLNFNTISTYPIYGSVTWSGNVNLAGGGMITATANGGASTFTLSNADLTVAEGTTFTLGNANVAVNGLPRINVTGNGKLSQGSITFVSGTMTGSFENDGTVILAGQSPSTGAYEDNQLNGTFLNRGKLLIQAPNIVSNGTLVNSQSGLIEFQHDSNFYGDYYGGALIQNAGNVQVDAGVKSVWIRAGWDNLGGTIDVKSGSLALSNNYGPSSNTPNTPRNTAFNAFGVVHNAVGLSTGGKFTVAAGATLDLRSTADQFGSEGGVFTGNYTGSGGGTVLIGGNMQMSQSDWNFPAGMLVWGDTKETGNSSLAFNWTNSGDLTLPSTIGTLSRNLRYGTLTNRGTIEIENGVRLNLTLDFQPGIAWIVNTAEGTITAGNGSYIYSDVPNSPTSSAPLFRNDGKVLFTGGGTVRTYLENYGTVEVHGGVGIQNPVLDRTSVVPTLMGTWIARSGGNVAFDPNGRASGVTTSSATLIADGAGSQVTGLITLTKNLGTIEAINGGSIALPGNLTNHGSLIAQSGGHVTIPGKYTQSSTGVLTTGIDSNSVTIAGTATLDGLFNAQIPVGFTPPSGFSADVLTAKSITGTFAQQNLGGLVSRITDKTVSLSLRTDASDLAISNVKILPAGGPVTPGTPLSVQFTVTNLSGKATQTGWNDTVFLSTDDTLDASDISLNRQADAGILAANASRTVTIPFTASSIPGSWVIIVSADSTVAIPDPNRSNNVGSALEPIRVSAPELPIGVDVAASFPAGNTAYYTLTRNAGAPPIRITAIGATMALRFAEPPMGDPSDTQSKGNPARLDLPTDHGGVYYLAVTRTGSGAVTVRAENASLGITGLGDESNLSSTIRVGDPITLTVIGTGFTAATTFKLGDATASRVEIQSPNQAIITVTAPAAGGPFFVNATTGSQTVTYSAKPFTAIASNSTSSEWDKLANWSFQVSLPSTIRVYREANVTVTFRNNSVTSQPAPLVQLFTDNGRFRLPTGDLLGESMIVLGVKANGRADMYAPGETGSFELVLQPTTFGPHVQSAVYAFDIGERGFSPTASPDPRAGTRTDLPLPAEVIDGLRPEGMADDTWTAVRAGLQEMIGTTYQSYANALRGAANRLVADGADTHDLGRLNRYLLNVANQFGQLSRRFELTAFGRGVENPYAVTASADATGMVTVSHGFNSRLFASSSGGFTALVPGDRGILTARPGGGYILTEADGSFTAFRPDGLFDFTQNLLGQKTTAAYTNGRLATLTDFRGDTTTLTYASNGRIATITDPVGRVTTYGFDATGQKLTSITVPTGTTTYTYSPDTTGPKAFTVTGITGPDGVTTAFEYDALGRTIKTTIGGQQAVTYIYGSGTDIGRVTSTDALSHSISAIYGEFGQLTTVQTTFLGDVDAAFNDAGLLSGIGSITVVRDANGNLTAAVPATGDAVRMSYDAAGVKLTSFRDPLGNATTFAYNPTGQIVSQSDPLGVEQFGYDAQGNPTANVTPGGRSAVATYDAHGLVTKRTYGDGSTTSFTYDAHRNLTAVTDAGPNNTSPKTVTLAYDTADRVTLITYPTGKTVGYHYDSAGRRDRITTSDGLTVGYTFDTLGRLKTVSRNTVIQVTYAFDAAGRLASKTFANGTSTVYTYDAMNRTTRIEHRGTGNTVIDFEAYTYSAEGRVATLTTRTA